MILQRACAQIYAPRDSRIERCWITVDECDRRMIQHNSDRRAKLTTDLRLGLRNGLSFYERFAAGLHHSSVARIEGIRRSDCARPESAYVGRGWQCRTSG
jgi:hypothetical protein